MFSFDGFTLDIPTGWDSTTQFDGGAVLTAASSRVSPGEGALGIGSQRFMRPKDVLVSIVEYPDPHDPAGFRPLSRPPTVDRSQITFYEGTPHVMFLQAYAEHGRYFQIGVAFGRNRPTAAQIALADRVLATLSVSPIRPGDSLHLGVAVAIPRSWSIAWRPCARCADPRSIFVAASSGLTHDFRAQMCDRVPAGAAIVSLSEVLPQPLGGQVPSPRDFPPRPASFRVSPSGRRLEVMEGCDQPRAYLVSFLDSHRFLYAWAVFGPHPSRRVLARVDAVLDSLRIAPLKKIP